MLRVLFLSVLLTSLAAAGSRAPVEAQSFGCAGPTTTVSQLVYSAVGFCFEVPQEWRYQESTPGHLVGSLDQPWVHAPDGKQYAILILSQSLGGDFAERARRSALTSIPDYRGYTVLSPMAPFSGTGANEALVGQAGYSFQGVPEVKYVLMGEWGAVDFTLDVTFTRDYLLAHPGIGQDMLASFRVMLSQPPVYHFDTHHSFLARAFNVHDQWLLTWWFDCSNQNDSTGNFIIETEYRDGSLNVENAIPVNELTNSDTGSVLYQAGGDLQFQVISECYWGLTIY